MQKRREWRTRTVHLALLFLLLISSALPARVLAQSKVTSPGGINIEISPLPIELNAKPGTSTSTDLRVRNAGPASEKLKASLKTFTAEGADGHLVLHDPGPNDEFTQWVSFNKTVFDAPPGQWQSVKMNINLPKSAAFGYYYAVQFELANPPKPQPGETSLQGAVVIFVLLNAEAPGATRKADVTSFTADHQTYEFLPANFNVAVHNSGNLHLTPHGNIFIRRGGKQVAALAVNPTQGKILPGSNRILTTSWSDGFPVYQAATDANGQLIKDAHGNPKKKLSWNFSKVSKLRFGHYTANLLLVYNDGQRDIPVTGTLSFWVIPWRLLGIIFGILALIAALAAYVIVLRRRLKKVTTASKKARA
jgi:hypothetical protein